MSDRFPVNLSLLHMLPDYLGARGVSAAALLARAGIDPPERGLSGAIATRGQVCAVLEQVSRKLGEAAVGLDIADRADPAALGHTGRAIFSGATLRHAIEAHLRTMPSLQAGVAFDLEVRGAVARLRHRFVGSDPNRTRVLTEGAMAFEIRALRAVVGETFPLLIAFPHRAMAARALYEDRLGAEVLFARGDDGASAIEFDAALLNRPNRARRPIDPAGGEAKAVAPAEIDLTRALGLLIPALAAERSLSLTSAADSLGYAPRSLQRRLAEAGIPWEARVDAWRHDQARACLAETDAPVAAISERLGYAHASHFLRAFRRWEGTTPAGFRHAILARNGY